MYKTSEERYKDTKHALIVDESMMFGSEKLLLTAGIPATHQGAPLKFQDVTILDMAVSNSWNAEKITTQLENVSKMLGKDPEYVISDNDSSLKKGIRSTKYKHYLDISHALGVILGKVYKRDTAFAEFCAHMRDTVFKHTMRRVGYLKPPKQRTIARFMNISHWITWSSKMLSIYHNLTPEEKEVYFYIPLNASLIEELSDVQKCISKIELTFKHQGLSIQSINRCKNIVKNYLFTGNTRMIHLGDMIVEFLTKEVDKVDHCSTHNNSSDIIESIFGKYKSRKSPNKLYGVTSFILFLPLCVRLSDNCQNNNFDFKNALEKIKMKDIKKWEKENLKENLVQLRIEKLKKAG